jgi:hypothetical protein
METMELHRGRLIDHVQLVVRDLAASRRFDDAVGAVLQVLDPDGDNIEAVQHGQARRSAPSVAVTF